MERSKKTGNQQEQMEEFHKGATGTKKKMVIFYKCKVATWLPSEIFSCTMRQKMTLFNHARFNAAKDCKLVAYRCYVFVCMLKYGDGKNV
jgi:hypothetical protein